MARVRVIVGALLACSVVVLFASSAAAKRSCGTFRAQRATYAVSVRRGNVRCHRARHVLRDLFDGRGTLHGRPNGPAYKQWWAVDGWRCGYGAGGAACILGSKSYKTARDWIEADWISGR